MSCRETTIRYSLMLNYITLSMLGSLFRSLRRRHFLVSLGISGSLILRLLIILSLGLLWLEYRNVRSASELSLQDVISPAKDFDYLHCDVSNQVAYWSLIKYGLPYPHGITPQFAVQSFETSDDGTCYSWIFFISAQIIIVTYFRHIRWGHWWDSCLRVFPRPLRWVQIHIWHYSGFCYWRCDSRGKRHSSRSLRKATAMVLHRILNCWRFQLNSQRYYHPVHKLDPGSPQVHEVCIDWRPGPLNPIYLRILALIEWIWSLGVYVRALILLDAL